MITKEAIDSFIEKIPPAPTVVKETLKYLNSGDLTQAAKVAQEDKPLTLYMKSLVNKPIYGFKNEVSEVPQIFGILGVSNARQAVYNYLMTLLSPSRWKLFKLNKVLFFNLQADLSVNWQKILTHLDIKDKEIESSITLLPASIIVCEALYCEKIADVELIRSAHPIDLNTILKRLSGFDIFDICQQIAQKWEMGESVAQIIQASSGVKPSEDAKINLLGKWMHLFLFYTLSQPKYVEAELNDFIDFQIDYVQDIYADFSELMEIS